MVLTFKVIPLDVVSFVLTVFAVIFHNVGFFIGAWWQNENVVGTSVYGMMELTLCDVACVDRSVLDIDGGREWIFAVRVFEVFGEIFVVIALLLAVLTLTIRKRPIYTALIYIHGAAALFIIVGVFIFLGLNAGLGRNLEGQSKLRYPFGLCLLAGILCICSSVVSGFSLKKHLLEWDDEEEEDLAED